MRLSRIEIENFKGIGERQVIHLKPITLLFGANSSGKSTILQALQYVREILERGNFDPGVTLSGALGNGGFRSLVHKQNLEVPIRIRLEFDFGDQGSSDHFIRTRHNSESDFDWPDWFPQEISLLEFLQVYGIVGEAKVKSFGIEIESRWSRRKRSAYLSSYSVFLNNERMMTVKADPGQGLAVLSDLNLEHPFLQPAYRRDDGEWALDPKAKGPNTEIVDALVDLGAEEIGQEDGPDRNVQVYLLSDFPYAFFQAQRLALYWPRMDDEGLPIERQETLVYAVGRLFDEVLLDPARLALRYLASMRHIGALRDVPDRSYRVDRSPLHTSWSRGEAAWDRLLTSDDNDLLDRVNDWLERRLGMSYRVAVLREKLLPVLSPLDRAVRAGVADEDSDELMREYNALPEQKTLLLRDTGNGVLVSLDEVGTGLSQLLPIILACCDEETELLAVEQPELHLHPAAQVELGDLFIEAIRDDADGEGGDAGDEDDGDRGEPSLLVETHSEHLILRLLRRIRETSGNELPPEAPSLTPGEIGVIHVSSSEEGTTYKELRVDEQGDFIDRWPSGFFEERVEELF